jgi:hypothetical protein
MIIRDYGLYRRVWPFATSRELFFTVGIARSVVPSNERVLRLYRINTSGNIDLLQNLSLHEPRIDTSGQPYFKPGLGLFIPAWNSEFYTIGKTIFVIFKSYDFNEYKVVYVDEHGSYGKHFFTDAQGTRICIGVGKGWNGKPGRVSYTPRGAYLLCSEDGGDHWTQIYEIKYPTAIYSGVIVDDIIAFTLRERGAVVVSFNGGKHFREIILGSSARIITFCRIEGSDVAILSSDDALFISDDFMNWKKIKLPTKGLALRYPTVDESSVFFTGVGNGSWIFKVSLDNFNIKDIMAREIHYDIAPRLALFNRKLYVGSELYGKLYSIEMSEFKRFNGVTNLRIKFMFYINLLKAKIGR